MIKGAIDIMISSQENKVEDFTVIMISDKIENVDIVTEQLEQTKYEMSGIPKKYLK